MSKKMREKERAKKTEVTNVKRKKAREDKKERKK